MNKGTPALFLDRDGVININLGYVYEVHKFEFFPEIMDICRVAQSANFLIVVVTNQSGIGRGYFSEEKFLVLTDWMTAEFKKEKIEIALVLYAPENPDSNEVAAIAERRKPSPNMILEASNGLKLNLADSIMIGDSETDMISAQRAGIKHRILIGTLAPSSVASIVVRNHAECELKLKEIIFRSQE